MDKHTQHVRTSSPHQDEEGEQLRIDRAYKVADLAYRRARITTGISIVAFLMAVMALYIAVVY
jgi:hypothetical protein